MGRTLFISDTHDYHKNIMKYESKNRQFKDLDEMHDEMLKRINSVVRPADILYMLGDIVFGGSVKLERFIRAIHCKVIGLKGNHDPNKGQQWYLNRGFYKWYDYPIIIDGFYILSHEPILFLSEAMPYVNIHGHTHSECFESIQRVNVCWDHIGGYPIDFNDIKAIFKDKEVS